MSTRTKRERDYRPGHADEPRDVEGMIETQAVEDGVIIKVWQFKRLPNFWFSGGLCLHRAGQR